MAVALAISLVLHALIYAGWHLSPVVSASFSSFIETMTETKRAEIKPRTVFPEPPRKVPMVFVEADPAIKEQPRLTTPEPPKETRNYSTENSLAANPTPPKQMEVPKIEGSQTRVLSTVDTPKPEPKPLEPNPPPPVSVETKPTPAEAEPKPTPPPDDLAMNKAVPKMVTPSTKPEGNNPPEKPRPKPRTLQEARARNPVIPGEKMRQEGGVERRARVSMVDAQRSPFGNYDEAFIGVVTARWYQLLDETRFPPRRGKVVLTFRMHYDGRISQLEMTENSAGDMLSLLCQKAVLDPNPFPRWPNGMRQLVGMDYREVKFTFYYD